MLFGSLLFFLKIYFNKLSIRRIAVKLMHVGTQDNSSLFLIQLGDTKLKPFLLAAASDKAQGLSACCVCAFHQPHHKPYPLASCASTAPSAGLIGVPEEKLEAMAEGKPGGAWKT